MTSKVKVCARFRPLSSSEIRDHGTSLSFRRVDDESFNFKDEKDGDLCFSFDKVFYEECAQARVYEFLALPIVQDAVNAINGTIITYGQTGAGKTYSMEGPGILKCDDQNKGLIPRVTEGLFEMISSSDEASSYSVKLSMVDIYKEKVRDLFDLSKDNIQIEESKSQGIHLSGVTEISVHKVDDALQRLSSGISNRAVGETRMNMASSRSHCLYIFTVQQDLLSEKRTKTGKLIFVDLAGSEKVEETGAEGRLLEEAKTINKSLSALGKVVNALTCSPQSKLNHIPYCDSKLTRMLQDALGGTCRMALLCCCSPSPSNASETLSTLRFGARAQHIKVVPCIASTEDETSKTQDSTVQNEDAASETISNEALALEVFNDVEVVPGTLLMSRKLTYNDEKNHSLRLKKSEVEEHWPSRTLIEVMDDSNDIWTFQIEQAYYYTMKGAEWKRFTIKNRLIMGDRVDFYENDGFHVRVVKCDLKPLITQMNNHAKKE